MANYFDQYDSAGGNHFDQYDALTIAPKGGVAYNAAAAPSMPEDVLKSFGGGLERGAAATLGLPGDAIKALRYGAKYLGLPTTQTPVFGGREALAETEKVVGKPYDPQTVPGEYARTAGEFLPALAGGAEGVGARALRYVAAPAIASETAGQVTKGTPFEGPARLAGALFGGVGVGSGVSRVEDAAATRALPTTEELKSSAKLNYDRAAEQGVVVAPESFSNMVKGLRDEVEGNGFDDVLHPKSAAVLKAAEKRAAEGTPKTLGQLDQLRQVIGDVGKSAEPGDRRIGKLLKDNLDTYLDNLTDSDVTSGHPLVAVNSLRQARATWQRAKKSELLDDVTEKFKDTAGQFSVSGNENAIRTEFRKLSRRKDFKRLFTTEEQQAIRRVHRGGPAENITRLVGKFAPTGVVPIVGASYLGGPVAGVGAGVVAGVGAAGRAAATRMAQRNANRVRHLAVAGKLPKKGSSSNLSAALAGRAALLSALNLGDADQ